MYSTLFTVLNKFSAVSEERFEEIKPLFSTLSIAKGDNLLKEGEICEQMVFITSGFLRLYVIDEENKDVTVHIARPGEFVSAFSSFITGKPSWESIQAVTNTDMLCIPKTTLDQLYLSSPYWEKLGRMIVEHNFVKKEDRVVSFIKMSSEQRYLTLIEKQPDIIQNVPLQYIASYLGMKPETLSRIRARIT